MARGNFSAYGASYKTRCRICMCIVAKKDRVRIGGNIPAHRECAENSGRSHTSDEVFISNAKIRRDADAQLINGCGND